MQNKPIPSNNWLGKKIKDYQIIRLIGEGGSSFVYECLKDKQLYAIKILKEAFSEAQERERQLERIKSQLNIRDKVENHPNIIKIYEGGVCEDHNCIFLIMEYLPTQQYFSLSDKDELRKLENGFGVNCIRTILSQVASAAHKLHDLHYAHRDIKPSNIMLSRSGNHAVLLDLGIMKNLLTRETFQNEDNSRMFDEQYMTDRYCPKEILFREPDLKKMDYKWEALSFYQLGTISYELLTGNKIFHEARGKAQLLSMIAGGLSIDEFNSDLPVVFKNEKDLIQMTMSCLNSEWERRVADVFWSDFNYENYQPTIILLHTGGTIGSKSNGGQNRELRGTIEERNKFYNAMKKNIYGRCKQIHDPINGLRFELVMESLDPTELLLSENARTGTWNAILTKLEYIINTYFPPRGKKIENYDVKKRYVAGIIILHGTDTMAYSAAALTFALKNLPCPIVITGANQPPNETDMHEQNIFASKSDTWKNLMLSINFIQCLGHRYTQVFVAFNNTIFHGINIKKVPIDHAYENTSTNENAINEPYTYQNIYLHRKYMFRQIDGIFCNNFYPVNYYDAGSKHDVLRNILNRSKAVNPQSDFSVMYYIDNENSINIGSILEVIYNTPVSDFRTLNMENKEAILLVGYDSNTFSSDPRHPLSSALANWTEKGKLIFLISEFGLFPTSVRYKQHEQMESRIDYCPVFGLIKETAVPFILNLLSCVRTKLSDCTSLIEKYDLIRNQIENNDEWKHSLPGVVLSNPFDHESCKKIMENNLNHETERYNEEEKALFQSLTNKKKKNIKDQARKNVSNTQSNTQNVFNTLFPKEDSPNENKRLSHLIKLQPEDFVWMLLNKCKKAISIGCGATEFGELNEMGYRWGTMFYSDTSRSKEPEANDNTFFANLTEEQRTRSRDLVKKKADHFVRILGDQGVIDSPAKANVSITQLNDRDALFTLTVEVRQKHLLHQSDELFEIEQFDDKEKEFFNLLMEGTAYKDDLEIYRNKVNQLFHKLNHSTWECKLDPMDWFILGVFNGFCCSCLHGLNFDSWVHECFRYKDSNREQLFKDSVQTTIDALTNERGLLKFTMSYLSRTEDIFDQEIGG